MHGSEEDDGRHSTLGADPRPKFFPRVMGSLAIFGVLVGLMIGRLTTPDPVVLERVEVKPQEVQLWFSAQPKLHGEHVDGTVGLLFDAKGKAQNGKLKVNGKDANWRLRLSDGGLLLTLVAARPLRGDWAGAEEDGRWKLTIQLREE